jgi:phenylacetate-CoA ligase
MPGTLLSTAADRASRLDRALAATAGVPFYERADWRTACALPDPRLEDLPRLTKAELRAHSPGDFLPRRFDLRQLEQSGEIEEESTSGTSGASVRVIFGRTWWAEQEARALRRHPLVAGLLAAEPAARRAVLTTPGCSGVSCFARWLNIEQRTLGSTLFVNQSRIPFSLPADKLAQMAAETAAWAPTFLDVDPVHGAWFALHCERHGLRFPSLRFILTSYEYTSVVHRRILERVFGVPVINLYGSSETGHLLIDHPGGGMVASPETAQLELADVDARGIGQLLVTTLTNEYLPLLRYEIGDHAERDGERWLVHGRLRDALRDSTGRVVTTRQADACFRDVTGVAHYQVRQTPDGSAQVSLLPEHPDGDLSAQYAPLAERLEHLLGGRVEVARTALIAPEDSGKFRLTVRLPAAAPSR